MLKESAEAARGVLSKKLFLRISQYSQENTRPPGQQLYWKETPTQVFSCEYSKFLRTSILKKICERVRLNRVLYVSHKGFIETLYLKSCLNCFNSLIVKRFLLKVYNKASFMFYSTPQLLLHVQFWWFFAIIIFRRGQN